MSKVDHKEATIIDNDLITVLKVRLSVQDKRRWCIHTVDNRKGRSCLAGHINIALHGYPDYRCMEDVNRIARKLGFENLPTLCSFNDTHTHKEVLSRLDEGIAHMREGI